tara:strand:+ start:175 stop:777 length:603 start_codon:yes stop_codon:yes gene_type:complete
MSLLNVNKVDPATGTGLELGSSGDTITIPSGATITNSGTATGFGEANSPYFFAYANSNSNVSDGSATKVQFNVEVLDSDNGYDTSNYKYTIPSGKAGIYKFDCSVKANKGSGSNAIYYYILQIKKNGSVQTDSILDMRNPASSVSDISQQLNQYTGITVNASAGDYFEIFAEIFTNGNTPVISGSGTFNTWFSGFRVATV